MPTAAVLRGKLESILPLVQARVASYTGLAQDRVLPIARPTKTVPHLVGDQDVLLRFRGFKTDGAQNNRGRHNRRCHHRLEVTVRTRFEMDTVDKETRWLTDAAKGNVVAWEAVADALEDFYPTDSAGNVLTDTGLALMEGLETVAEVDVKGAKSFWGETTLVYLVTVILPLKQLPPGQP